ncbi:phage tail domain-containing protein [Domibacillus enclensis]|uniref:Phage tail protein n=1 Tax=Domibacillus enclensis TaxID=1017273 RepID=A0A1N6WK65_9BACI|nr:phage tail domain-containing protein [Domibacillus enclensis]OXS77961.1 hypothetical protein B1B05_10165 [Domibacillus enclensis]SIQ90442.1 Phage tail protein [Domibacillus enclensis]
MINNLIVQRLDGRRYDLMEIGVITKRFEPSSPAPKHIREEIDGMDGYIDVETTYEGRSIRGEFILIADETFDKKRDEVFQLFDSREAFFVTKMSAPNKCWLVKADSSYTLEQIAVVGNFTIDFSSSSAYAKSPGTTLNMPAMEHYYSVGAGKVNKGDPVIQYSFDQPSFSVFNDSDIMNDPAKHMEQRIILRGELNNPVIRNLTTGDEWSWTGTATDADEIVLDGIRSLKNGQSIFGQTNKNLIRFAPGWNDFEIEGASAFTVSFDLTFYYL